MTMMEKTLALLALAALIGFCGIIVWFVPDTDLTIITVLVIAMAVYDFYRNAFRRKNSGK